MNAKEVLNATVFGEGTANRFSNNYEAIQLAFVTPFFFHNRAPQYGEENVVDAWGVTNSWPAGTPGQFPVHSADKVVIKDFGDWEQYVKFPNLDFASAEWEQCIAMYESMDRTKTYASAFVAPGLFERMHHLGKIDETLMALYEYEDEVHDLIKKLVEWELKMAEGICTYVKPDSLFHHDDWGSMTSTFMSVDMFEEFFVDPYKEIYGYYHDHGCKLVSHHSDSYAATLIPDMIEMGINVFQGAVASNNIPECVKKYGDKIAIMGGFDGAMVDKPGMTMDEMRKVVKEVCDAFESPKGFIPCIAQGGPGSVYKGVYKMLADAIDEYNMERFGLSEEEVTDRAPHQIIFPGTEEL